MRLEKWFISNLDDSQRKIIIQSIDDDIIVQGAAGSGKTNLAIHRALQAKNKGSYAIVIFTVALKRMIAYGMQALGLDKERIAYEWAWTNRGFDLTGDVYWEKGNRNVLYLVNDLNIRKFERTEKDKTSYGIDFADWVAYRFYSAFGRRVSWFREVQYTSGFSVTNTERFELIPSGTMYKQSEDCIDYLIIDEAQDFNVSDYESRIIAHRGKSLSLFGDTVQQMNFRGSSIDDEAIKSKNRILSDDVVQNLIVDSANRYKNTEYANTEKGMLILGSLREFWTYKHNQCSSFNIPDDLIVLKSLMAFFIKPFGFDQIERYVQNKGIGNKEYGYMLRGALVGYAAFPKTFTEALYADENIYIPMDDYLTMIHKQVETQYACN